MNNDEARYLLKLFTIVDNSELEEKNSKEFKKLYRKLEIVDKQIATSEKYNEDMKELTDLLVNLEKEFKESEKEEVK